jgi:hypothetical protein
MGARLDSGNNVAHSKTIANPAGLVKAFFLTLCRFARRPFVVYNENTGQKPSERLMTEMGKLIDEMTKEGTLVRTAGLRPTKEGFRVRSRHGKLSTTDGPFTESKEVIGGYAVLEAKSKEHAIELTKRFLAVHGDEWDLECEVRPLDGQEFGA